MYVRQVTVAAVLVVALLACSIPAPPTAAPRSVDEDVAEANARLAEQIATAEEVAEDHVDNARDYWEEGDFGLTLTELRQALAVAPWYDPAVQMREQVAATATAAVREVTAGAATATTETLQVAAATAARERARQQAADRTEASRVLAVVASSDPITPQGGWVNDDTPITVAVGKLGSFSADAGRAPANGQRLVRLGVYVKNRSGAPIQVEPADFTLITSDGQSHPSDPGSGGSCPPPLPATNVAPGSNTNGCLVFLSDGDAEPAAVVYASPATRGAVIAVDLQRLPDLNLPS
jgi:hypothetical protein